MSLSKKKRADKRSVDKITDSKAIDADRKGRRTGFIIASAVVAVIILIVIIGQYISSVPFRRTVITVDDVSISMDYFLKRAKLGSADTMQLLETITKEQIIKLTTPRFGIEVTPEDIDWELRRTARGESETITDIEFNEWYRQQLNETILSESEFNDLVATSIMTVRLHQLLADRVPTIAEQVHLYTIILETYEDAENIKARWEAGEDFFDLAREASMHPESGDQGGDIGWWPRGIDVLFDSAFYLNINEVSDPLGREEGFYLFMISERADARELNENTLEILQAKILDSWFIEEMPLHEISYNMNSEIYAWISWQLAKIQDSQ